MGLVGGDAASPVPVDLSQPPGLHLYGAEAPLVQALPGADRALGGGLTEAMVRFAARHDYARTVEDVLARRSRHLFLDARLAAPLAREGASLLRPDTRSAPGARRLPAPHSQIYRPTPEFRVLAAFSMTEGASAPPPRFNTSRSNRRHLAMTFFMQTLRKRAARNSSRLSALRARRRLRACARQTC